MTPTKFVPLLTFPEDYQEEHSVIRTINDFEKDSISPNSQKSLLRDLKTRKDLVVLKIHGYYFQDEHADALVEIIAANLSLEEISLNRNSFSNGSVQKIMDALKQCAQLKILNLEYNGLNDSGAKIVADYLQKNPPVLTVILNNNSISSKGFQHLKAAVKSNSHLTTLNAYHNQEVGRKEFKEINKKLEANQTNKTNVEQKTKTEGRQVEQKHQQEEQPKQRPITTVLPIPISTSVQGPQCAAAKTVTTSDKPQMPNRLPPRAPGMPTVAVAPVPTEIPSKKMDAITTLGSTLAAPKREAPKRPPSAQRASDDHGVSFIPHYESLATSARDGVVLKATKPQNPTTATAERRFTQPANK